MLHKTATKGVKYDHGGEYYETCSTKENPRNVFPVLQKKLLYWCWQWHSHPRPPSHSVVVFTSMLAHHLHQSATLDYFFMSVVVNLVNMNLSLLNFINRTSLSAGSFSKYNKSHLYFKVYWYYVIFQTTINRLRYDFIFLGSKRKTSYNFHTTWRWCPPSRRHFTLRGVKEQIFGGNCPESNSGGHCLCDITWHDMTSRDTFGTVSHD